MSKRKWPSIDEVAKELRLINENTEGPTPVYLQALPNVSWLVMVGHPVRITGAGSRSSSGMVPGVVKGRVCRFNSVDLARHLIWKCKEAWGQ